MSGKIGDLTAILKAAEGMDWQQVVLNGGPPCFHVDDDGKFCGRAERWVGHEVTPREAWSLHSFVSLAELIRRLSAAPSGAQARCPRCGKEGTDSQIFAAIFPDPEEDGVYAQCTHCDTRISLEFWADFAQFFSSPSAPQVVCNWRQDGNPPFNCKLPANHFGEHSPNAAQPTGEAGAEGLTRFETLDLILPRMGMPEDGVFITLQLSESHVDLRIGGRDIRWSRETGRVTDTGLFINPEQAEQV